MQVPPISGHGEPSCTILPETKSRAFTARTYRAPASRFLWHYHPEWEIVFTQGGFGTRHVGSSVEPYVQGDLVLLPGNVPHTWVSSPEQKEATRCTVIHFLPHVWGDQFWRMSELRKFKMLCQNAQRGVRFDGAGTREIGRKMEELAAFGPPTVVAASLEALSKLLSIFSDLAELSPRPLHSDKGHSGWQNPRLDALLGWIESRIGESITQQDAADHVNMSAAAFSRWFKTNMGCVFGRYLNEIRVARVCAEITDGKLSITEAAFKAGYNNLSNFNRRFMEITGLTPKAFRAQVKGPRTLRVP